MQQRAMLRPEICPMFASVIALGKWRQRAGAHPVSCDSDTGVYTENTERSLLFSWPA